MRMLGQFRFMRLARSQPPPNSIFLLTILILNASTQIKTLPEPRLQRLFVEHLEFLEFHSSTFLGWSSSSSSHNSIRLIPLVRDWHGSRLEISGGISTQRESLSSGHNWMRRILSQKE